MRVQAVEHKFILWQRKNCNGTNNSQLNIVRVNENQSQYIDLNDERLGLFALKPYANNASVNQFGRLISLRKTLILER